MALALSKDSIDVGIVVNDLSASERFYRDVLGLEHVDDLDHVPGMLIRRYACGTSLLKLVALDPAPRRANPAGGAQGGIGLRYLTIYVEDVDHVVYRCLDAGIEVPQLPIESRPGVFVAKVADPDGNWLEIITKRTAPVGTTVAAGPAQGLPDGVAGLELCWGTLGRPWVPEYLTAAAAGGFEHATIRPSFYRSSVEGGADPAEMAALARGLGLDITVVDSLSSALPGSPDPATLAPGRRPLFEVTEQDCYQIGELFGAGKIQVTNFLGGAGVERAEMIEAFGALADRAAGRGFEVLLEFIPDSGIPDLAAAVEIITAVGRANASIMVDTWHLARTGGTAEELRAVPPRLLGGLQISDCPHPPEAMAVTAFPPGGDYVPGQGRLLPGEGRLPLADIIAAVVANNPPLLVGVEVFNAGMRGLPPTNAAALARRSLANVLR